MVQLNAIILLCILQGFIAGFLCYCVITMFQCTKVLFLAPVTQSFKKIVAIFVKLAFQRMKHTISQLFHMVIEIENRSRERRVV